MIDFHVHSTASDGTLAPREVAAAGASFAALALTDHDNCDGARAFLETCAELGAGGVRLAGIELSVLPGEGFGSFHMLGLGIDPQSAELEDFLLEIRRGRDARNLKIIERLNALGMAIAVEEVSKYANGKIVARPHIARVLVEKGYGTDIADVFERLLRPGRPGYVPRYRPEPHRAIAVIHAAGGAAVMAHPKYFTQDFAQLEARLGELKAQGLDGLEAVYQANAPEETIAHLGIAKRLDLAPTAGSDFHGDNKPAVTLGMEVADEAAFLAPALARIRGKR